MELHSAEKAYSYDPETGHFIRKQDAGHHGGIGDVAGCRNSLGYILVTVDGKQVLGHRLAWLMAHGELPALEIDHRNGDPADNRLCNLRQVTHQQNMINRKLHSNNTSGFKGVSVHKQSGRWRARIKNPVGKYEHIGMYDSPECARQAYRERAIQLHGEYARQED